MHAHVAIDTRLGRLERAKAEWRAGEPVEHLMPIRFPSGARLDEIDCYCAQCRAQIPPRQMRGQLSWPVAHVATLDLWGVCRECRLLTPFNYRFRDRGAKGIRMEWRHPTKGWVYTDGGRPIVAWLDSVVDWARGVLGRLLMFKF